MHTNQKHLKMILLWMMVGGCAVAADQASWESLAEYEFGKYTPNICALETEIRVAPAGQFEQYEDKLLVLLNTQNSSREAKQFACRMLRLVGSEKCVPVLAGFLADEKLGHMSRYALQGLPFPSVDDALRNALAKTTGMQQAGVISSLGVRKDAKSVPLLKPLMTDADMAVARESVCALGRIASPDALEALVQAKVVEGLKTAVLESQLMCADALLAMGKVDQAAVVYRKGLGAGNSGGVRAAAMIGLARAVKDDALPTIFEMLKSQDRCSQRAAGSALLEIKAEPVSKAIVDVLGSLSADAQVIAIHVLAVNGTKAIVPDIVKLTGSAQKPVRVAAVEALAALGDVSDIELLASLAKEGGEVGRVVVESLSRRSGKDASEEIMKVLPRVEAASRTLLIGCLAERKSHEAVADLIRYAEDSDENVRAETFKALGSLAQEKEIPSLIGLMLRAKPERVRLAAERAVSIASAMVDGADKKSAPLLAAMKDANPDERVSLLHCLGILGGDKALDRLRGSIRDSNETVQEAAIRVMADWKDEGAVADLRELANNAPKQNLKIIAFRGLVRIVSLPESVKNHAGNAVASLVEAMSMAPRTDEKRLVLGALSGIASLAALDAAQKCMPDADLRTEAELACIKIVQQFKTPGPERDKAMAVLKSLAETTQTESIRKQAAAILDTAK
ncbi:MAG: HEAT repeat domain-containing protein [Verrucomicrobiota bacterium]